MRIIKPYGNSDTHVAGHARTGPLKRYLHQRKRDSNAGNQPEEVEVYRFALNHDELVIAQWISVIDTVFRKPAIGKIPSQKQYDDRLALGDACWELMHQKSVLKCFRERGEQTQMKALWDWKISPYKKPFPAKKKQQGFRGKPIAGYKGRWHHVFVGQYEKPVGRAGPHNRQQDSQVNYSAVALRIYRHLYEAEMRICNKGSYTTRKQGRIEARAKSIESNYLKQADRVHNDIGNTLADEQRRNQLKADYLGASSMDVAQEIVILAQEIVNGTSDKALDAPRRLNMQVAAIILRRKYAELFGSCSIAEARAQSEELLLLHMAIRDYYSRLLKKHYPRGGNADAVKKNELHWIATVLPQDMDSLLRRVGGRSRNRDLNSLVRLGRVVHYTALALGDTEISPDVLERDAGWWTSQGQARIKRSEAFIRIWRHTITLASRTLTDWADPERKVTRDILGSNQQAQALSHFQSANFRQKLQALFGVQAGLFLDEHRSEFERCVLSFALQAVAGLRNTVFHFRDLKSFTQSLRELEKIICKNEKKEKITLETSRVKQAVLTLWQQDNAAYHARTRQLMEAADMHFFFNGKQLNKFAAELASWRDAEEHPELSIPLPRFSAILSRYSNAWCGKGSVTLPEKPNANDLTQPWRKCQFHALKLLYERPFRCWFQKLDRDIINELITKAVERSTHDARAANKQAHALNPIEARASRLPGLGVNDTIEDFFATLSRETASDIGVQKGYESDGANARKQANYLEKLKQDIVLQAFQRYIKEQAFGFILALSNRDEKPERPLTELPEIAPPSASGAASLWQAILYFVLHLVPVDEAGQLLHQIRKWQVLVNKANDGHISEPASDAIEIANVLELYLAMHDAKSEGGISLENAKKYAGLYVLDSDFSRIFTHADVEAKLLAPKRGLREIIRYGDLGLLLHLSGNAKIKTDAVDTFLDETRQKQVISLSEQREKLHDTWVKSGSQFSEEQRVDYAKALHAIIAHRNLSAQVTLSEHIRAHRLVLKVLGRLVDFSGLWERDLYFVMVALAYEDGVSVYSLFKKDGKKALRNGQIIKALENMESQKEKSIHQRLALYFGDSWDTNSKNARNDFAHFNMLQPAAINQLNLTLCVQNARRLMFYDRKLKNAVAHSIIKLLRRENLEIEWKVAADGALTDAKVSAVQIRHLEKQNSSTKKETVNHALHLSENLHGDSFINMIACAFGGRAEMKSSILDSDINNIRLPRVKPYNKVNGFKKNAQKPAVEV
ncbi:type VI-A CRISPR-associated RNA-guided ribonuclease Cas13a [Microvirga sp. W0021]|uniref:CRISPR-associated endoribonuclease Cas13a n=1 Tax=Hohaiivirga grylli TaxID=3133970 RepID=A0ABV0BH74_9HYPH